MLFIHWKAHRGPCVAYLKLSTNLIRVLPTKVELALRSAFHWTIAATTTLQTENKQKKQIVSFYSGLCKQS
jgi:hypothetical protein